MLSAGRPWRSVRTQNAKCNTLAEAVRYGREGGVLDFVLQPQRRAVSVCAPSGFMSDISH
jgi:hypothetical protein